MKLFEEQEPCYFCGGVGIKHHHHIIPKSMRKYVEGDYELTIPLCPTCHVKLHGLMKPLEAGITELARKQFELKKSFLEPWTETQLFKLAVNMHKTK